MASSSPGTDPNREAAPRWDPVLLWILAGALAIRLGVLFLVSPTPLASDELDYFWRAAERAQGLEPENAGLRPPLMEFFYGGIFRLTGASIPVARFVTVLTSVLLLIPLYHIGDRLGGRRTARLAAALAALYPNFIGFSHSLWSETLFLALTLSGIVLVGSHVERPALWKLAAAGIAFGLSALTRVVGVAFPILVAGWLVWTYRSELRRSLRSLAAPACLLVATALPIAPWTLELNRGEEPFALLARTTWYNLYIGNMPDTDVDPVIRYMLLGDTWSEREAQARELVPPEIRARLPAWPFEKLATELPDFFNPKSFPVRRLQILREFNQDANWAWSYRFRFEALESRSFRNGAGVLMVCSYVGIVLLGALGIALMPGSRWRQLLLLFVLSQVLPTIATFAISRFRIPAMSVALLGAAWLIHTGPAAWRQASRGARVTAVAAGVGISWMIALRWDRLATNAWG